MVEQGIDQCPVEIACRRMDDQAGGFVHDQQMLILEDDRQRDVLRRVVRRFGFGNGQAEALATPDLGRGVADRASIRLERAAADQVFQSFS